MHFLEHHAEVVLDGAESPFGAVPVGGVPGMEGAHEATEEGHPGSAVGHDVLGVFNFTGVDLFLQEGAQFFEFFPSGSGLQVVLFQHVEPVSVSGEALAAGQVQVVVVAVPEHVGGAVIVEDAVPAAHFAFHEFRIVHQVILVIHDVQHQGIAVLVLAVAVHQGALGIGVDVGQVARGQVDGFIVTEVVPGRDLPGDIQLAAQVFFHLFLPQLLHLGGQLVGAPVGGGDGELQGVVGKLGESEAVAVHSALSGSKGHAAQQQGQRKDQCESLFHGESSFTYLISPRKRGKIQLSFWAAFYPLTAPTCIPCSKYF